jgi:hypothetical protein
MKNFKVRSRQVIWRRAQDRERRARTKQRWENDHIWREGRDSGLCACLPGPEAYLTDA